MKFFGIADAHGIESFIKGDPSDPENSHTATMLHLRAGLNRQRHAVVYKQIWMMDFIRKH